MVFFVCETCNESLKKNKVETHSYSCRNCWVLTCVDCNKQFTGDTYAAHNACMTEAQRYEGKLYDGRTNKGDVKQALWIDRVRTRAADPSVAAHLRPHVERLLGHDNIPRKRAKFENFAKNSLRLHDAKTLGALWSIFELATTPAADAAATPIPISAVPPPEPDTAAAVADVNGGAARTQKRDRTDDDEEALRKAAKKAAKGEKKDKREKGEKRDAKDRTEKKEKKEKKEKTK
jgi:cell growth-regulating nucleolar protein